MRPTAVIPLLEEVYEYQVTATRRWNWPVCLMIGVGIIAVLTILTIIIFVAVRRHREDKRRGFPITPSEHDSDRDSI